MAAESAPKDRFEVKLDEMIETVRNCQQEHRLNSCAACAELIGCDVRRAYVSAVYDSMSKGETGGFEF